MYLYIFFFSFFFFKLLFIYLFPFIFTFFYLFLFIYLSIYIFIYLFILFYFFFLSTIIVLYHLWGGGLVLQIFFFSTIFSLRMEGCNFFFPSIIEGCNIFFFPPPCAKEVKSVQLAAAWILWALGVLSPTSPHSGSMILGP